MYIRAKVTPGAKKESISVEKENTLSISVREEAKHNLANRRVLELVARHFKLLPRDVRIISGHHGRTKLLEIID